MTKTSLLIPIYNEIKWIERTLQSVIGEADEILICDNASTDGTSEICQEFAKKHPEVKYIRHKENMGASKNWLYCLDNATGEYVRTVGGHDIISRGSTKSMLKIFEENPDASLVFSKNIIMLDPNYSFQHVYPLSSEYNEDKLIKELSSDNEYLRVESSLLRLKNWYPIYGLHKSKLLKKVFNKYSVFEYLDTDVIMLPALAEKGKIIADYNSTFWGIDNRKGVNGWFEICHRIVKNLLNINDDNKVNASAWPFAYLCGAYELCNKMQKQSNAPKNFSKRVFNEFAENIIKLEGFELSTDNITIIPGKKALVQEVIEAVSNPMYSCPQIKFNISKLKNVAIKFRIITLAFELILSMLPITNIFFKRTKIIDKINCKVKQL